MSLHLITVTYLVDAKDAEAANAAVTNAAQQCSGRVDHELTRSEPVDPQLQEMHEKGQYQAGDAFSSWFIFSRSEQLAGEDDPAGFWSNELGWCPLDLATPFSPEEGVRMPMCRNNDATLIPYRQAVEIQANGIR